jgi:hypothetical protein
MVEISKRTVTRLAHNCRASAAIAQFQESVRLRVRWFGTPGASIESKQVRQNGRKIDAADHAL